MILFRSFGTHGSLASSFDWTSLGNVGMQIPSGIMLRASSLLQYKKYKITSLQKGTIKEVMKNERGAALVATRQQAFGVCVECVFLVVY